MVLRIMRLVYWVGNSCVIRVIESSCVFHCIPSKKAVASEITSSGSKQVVAAMLFDWKARRFM